MFCSLLRKPTCTGKKKKMEKRNEWQECSRIGNSSREDIVSSIDCDLLFVERNTSTGNHLCAVRQ